jgi:hypothetical protein
MGKTTQKKGELSKLCSPRSGFVKHGHSVRTANGEFIFKKGRRHGELGSNHMPGNAVTGEVGTRVKMAVMSI